MMQVTWTILPEHELLEHALHWHSGVDATGGKVRLLKTGYVFFWGGIPFLLFDFCERNTISVCHEGDADALYTA